MPSYEISDHWPIIHRMLQAHVCDGIKRMYLAFVEPIVQEGLEELQEDEENTKFLDTPEGLELSKEWHKHKLRQKEAGRWHYPPDPKFLPFFQSCSWIGEVLKGELPLSFSAEFREWFKDRNFREELRRRILAPLDPPYPLTLEELYQIFEEQFRVLPDEVDAAYDRFVVTVHERLEETINQPSDEFPVLRSEIDQKEWIEQDTESAVIWRHPSFRCYWSRSGGSASHMIGSWGDEEWVYDGTVAVSASIYGEVSQIVRDQLYTSVPQVLHTAYRSAELLESTPDAKQTVDMPTIPFECIEKYQPFAGWMLEHYFIATAEQIDDSSSAQLKRRIGNAVLFLVESDRETNSALKFACCIMAIEAIVGDPRGAVQERLGRYVGLMLEPVADHRLNVANFVRDLYDTRSSVMHGRLTTSTDRECTHARALASGVLYSLFMNLHQIYAARQSGQTTPDLETVSDLLGWLNDATYKPDTFWAPETKLTSLWRSS